MRKFSLRKTLISLITLVCFVIFIYSVYNIFIWKEDNDKNKDIQKETNSLVDDKDISSALSDISPDAKGYLYVPGTNIDYVVVQGKDNSYYLKHNLKKEYNISGWVFFDYRNKLDGSDKNIIIYGHDTKDGSMFGSLKKILTSSWQKDNKIIRLKINDQEYKYEVFSVYEIKKEDYYIKTSFNNDFNDFVSTLKNRSVYDFKVDTSNTSQILTLSTCSKDGTKRVVLHAKKA